MINSSTTKKHIILQSLVISALVLCFTVTHGQDKVLDHPDFAIWKTIQNERISNNGEWVGYQLTPHEGDPSTHIYRVSDNSTATFERCQELRFTADNKYAIFRLVPPDDTVKAMKRRKVDDDDLPLDTLVILDLSNMTTTRIPNVKRSVVPEKGVTHVAYTVSPQEIEAEEADDQMEEEEPEEEKKKKKKYSSKNGYLLIVHDLENGAKDSLDYVKDFEVAMAGAGVGAISTGRDSTLDAGVYYYDGEGFKGVKLTEGDYKELSLNEQGDKLAFLGDTDTTDARIRPWQLFLWQNGLDSAVVCVETQDDFMPEDWLLSEHGTVRFSEDGNLLHYGIAPPPVLQDTSLLDDEIVNVEVWHYEDERLYTQQNVRAKRERERTYLAVVDLKTDTKMLVADESSPETIIDRKARSRYILATNESPYLRDMSWTGMTLRDVYVYDLETGSKQLIAEAIDGSPSVSPGDQYVSWYSRRDSAWIIQTIDGTLITSTKDIPAPMYDALNDRPMHPYPNGRAGWTEGDERMLVYSTFDIWSVDPTGAAKPVNLTRGRDAYTRYRYISLDREEESIDPAQPMLLYVFDEKTKHSGYASLNLSTGELTNLLMQDAQFDNRPIKAREADVIVFTRETFQEFPDLRLTTDRFGSNIRISDANPQQAEYNWGTAELFRWKAFNGTALEGVLVKPENFDSAKQYPVIVNFYERSSDRLYQHRAPYPHRSTINYAFYASRGYIIFNPDVIYEIGHPGRSAFNCVVSGVEALTKLDYVDPDRIGVQGHSWGGYQVAELITRTDRFACAESGAPVVNMTSAYGGIRWGSGLSRMFQYEHTQSRIGATLWENPDLYIENSPLFNLDKVSTPVLILHNDKDGAVPWYQGIEFFVAMRRLGKPAWMLNYNDEPHWPVKLQNRKDFNIRMQQFFDHYLMDAPMPKWMQDGVPAIHKGILQGYETVESDRND